MAARILAILAAVLLVVTFALATLGSYDVTLARGLVLADQNILVWLRPEPGHPVWGWIFEHLVMPFLVRPVWLAPAVLALVCAGGSVTLASYGTQRSRHRRS